MNLFKTLGLSLSLIILIVSCTSDNQQVADIIIQNGTIYTANTTNDKVEAVAIVGDRIIDVGTVEALEKYKAESTRIIDLQGKTMTPGFIEGHGHMMGLGYNELDLNLLNVKSYDEMVAMVEEAAGKAAPGDWILGRGWHQDKWDNSEETMIKGFQTNKKLSEVSPDNPVFLRHASGHAAIANQKAMEMAGITPLSKEGVQNLEVEGGEVIKDGLGNPTGILVEPSAMNLVRDLIPENSKQRQTKALQLAMEACWRNGIVGFHDAGADTTMLDLYNEFDARGELGVRMYVMLTGWDRGLLNEWYERGPMVDTTDFNLTIRSIKLNCDGALGSRGAWLLEEYTDRPGHYGHETVPMDFVEETSNKALKAGFQVCSHAIGDRANREILDRYEAAFNNYPNRGDVRFRIEHAQHLHPEDIPRFGDLGVIPAMQAIHMASDRPWAIDRLGEKRIVEGAYVWNSLIESGAVIVNGTDVPVEPIDPIASFYASVSRKTLKGTPKGGYEPQQKMTREQALKSYTWNAAYGAFQEDYLGSIEKGKMADFTVFDQDIMAVDEDKILDTQVSMTIIGGKVVYSNE